VNAPRGLPRGVLTFDDDGLVNMEDILVWTVLMIFVAAIVGVVIRYRTRDKCLKSFENFFITLELPGRKHVWGKLAVYHNAIELIYPSPHLDPDGQHYETSYILYQHQFNEMIAIKRLHDELTPRNQKQREKEIQLTYHPQLLRRWARRLRNMINLLRDAVAQAFNTFLAQTKKTSTSALLATQDARISDTARQIISTSASAYEPILEKYIGHRVVLEIAHEDGIREYCGILKDYSDAFITILDVPVAEEHAFSLIDPDQLKVNRDLDFEISTSPAEGSGEEVQVDMTIKVTNRSRHSVCITQAEADAYNQKINADLISGESVVVELASVPVPELSGSEEAEPSEGGEDRQPSREQDVLPNLKIWIRARRQMDMIVPRSKSAVRHGAEQVGTIRLLPFIKLVGRG